MVRQRGIALFSSILLLLAFSIVSPNRAAAISPAAKSAPVTQITSPDEIFNGEYETATASLLPPTPVKSAAAANAPALSPEAAIAHTGKVGKETAYSGSSWEDGTHATFYGSPDASGTMAGACGYGNLYATGYGVLTAAISQVMWNDGFSCGACYEVACVGSQYVQGPVCNPTTVTVTISNLCPTEGNPLCAPPFHHLDMSEPAWAVLSPKRVAGVLQTKMRRVPCPRQGGLRFMLSGNPFYLQTLVFNVGGAGDIRGVEVSADGGPWMQMEHNWGAQYSIKQGLLGKALGFRITSSSGDVLTVNNAAGSNWYIGQTVQVDQNFASTFGGSPASAIGTSGRSAPRARSGKHSSSKSKSSSGAIKTVPKPSSSKSSGSKSSGSKSSGSKSSSSKSSSSKSSSNKVVHPKPTGAGGHWGTGKHPTGKGHHVNWWAPGAPSSRRKSLEDFSDYGRVWYVNVTVNNQLTFN